MSTAQQFLDLFHGSDLAHGTFTVTGVERTGDGKKKGRASVVHGPATEELWATHLSGGEGLGVIPINSKNSCRWGAIDIDDYKFDHKALVQRLREHGVPAVVGRSKSGGAHVFLFVSEPVSAESMQQKLKGVAASIGRSEAEIFPKQTELLVERGDRGNFLNMPYHNGTKNMRYVFDDNGNGLEAEEFLEYVKPFVKTAEEFYRIDTSLGVSDSEHLPDGPPCLQHLCTNGFVPGSRNNALFNIGVYARLRDNDNWEQLVQKYNVDYLHPPLAKSEVDTVIKQLKKKSYFYKCEDQPIKPHCNKDVCRHRKYGVGGGVTSTVTGITKIDGDPPVFIITIDGKPVETTTEGIHSQAVFQKHAISQINKYPATVSPQVWQSRMQSLLDTMTVVPVMADATTEGEFNDLLREFVDNRAAGGNLEEILQGIPIWSDGKVHLQMKDLKKHLAANKFEAYSGAKISAVLKAMGGEAYTMNVKGKDVNVWSFPEEMFGVKTEAPAPVERAEPNIPEHDAPLDVPELPNYDGII